MKYLLLLFSLLAVINLNAQAEPWEFNESSITGIEGASCSASGRYSTASGFKTSAIADYSTAMGARSSASGFNSTAMGASNALGDYSTAMGTSYATGDYSTAMGISTSASGYVSTVMGEYTRAEGDYSIAMGLLSAALGANSTAMGEFTLATGFVSTAMGSFTDASGDHSTAMGYWTSASDFGMISIGHYNTDNPSGSSTSFDLSNKAFVIGNGLNNENRSDAMLVLFDGTTTIAGDLTVNADVRLKTNIRSLGSTLLLLKNLEGKTYQLKSDESKEKIGLIAQDVIEVFPQLVRAAKDEQGTLSVNYQGLIPVLINAVNEQQEQIKKYEERFDQQQVQIEKLTALVESLLKDQ